MELALYVGMPYKSIYILDGINTITNNDKIAIASVTLNWGGKCSTHRNLGPQ